MKKHKSFEMKMNSVGKEKRREKKWNKTKALEEVLTGVTHMLLCIRQDS